MSIPHPSLFPSFIFGLKNNGFSGCQWTAARGHCLLPEDLRLGSPEAEGGKGDVSRIKKTFIVLDLLKPLQMVSDGPVALHLGY